MPVEKFKIQSIIKVVEALYYLRRPNMIYRTSKAVAPYEIKTRKIFVITRLAK